MSSNTKLILLSFVTCAYLDGAQKLAKKSSHTLNTFSPHLASIPEDPTSGLAATAAADNAAADNANVKTAAAITHTVLAAPKTASPVAKSGGAPAVAELPESTTFLRAVPTKTSQEKSEYFRPCTTAQKMELVSRYCKVEAIFRPKIKRELVSFELPNCECPIVESITCSDPKTCKIKHDFSNNNSERLLREVQHECTSITVLAQPCATQYARIQKVNALLREKNVRAVCCSIGGQTEYQDTTYTIYFPFFNEKYDRSCYSRMFMLYDLRFEEIDKDRLSVVCLACSHDDEDYGE